VFTRILAVASLSAAACLYPASAQEGGSPDSGFNYAKQACAHCHAIRKGDNHSPNPRAPSFETIANSSGVTGISLAATLHSIHENMPNLVLRANERDNVIAYILSLKREH
jgi:mono/diheme cytochrome c family protein